MKLCPCEFRNQLAGATMITRVILPLVTPLPSIFSAMNWPCWIHFRLLSRKDCKMQHHAKYNYFHTERKRSANPRSTTGIFDRNLSLVDTSHVMVTVHLQKYFLFLCFSPTVRRYATRRRNVQCLYTYQVEKCCIPTTRFYLTSGQVTCVDNQYHAITWRGYVNVSCCGNAVTTTRQTSDTSMNFCRRNESWKQCEDYSLGFLYNEQLLVLCQTHKSRKRGLSLPFSGTWLRGF